MRKNSPRKWLHAVLDLLPVILIPVFMIYSHRHTIDDGSIDVPQNQVVDFNQLNNAQFIEFDNEDINGVIFDTADNKLSISFNGVNTANVDKRVIAQSPIDIKYGHVYYFKSYYSSNIQVYSDLYGSNVPTRYGVHNGSLLTAQYDYDLFTTWFRITELNTSVYLTDITLQIFDFTQMFGSGNEPTIAQFNLWYSNDYYSYTLSHKELLKNTSTINYSDTDIMSQFTYQLYNSVDKYFNMGNVFNMNGVYDWFNLNIFNGNAPISIYIVWNIVLYEFVMDLLFLLYGLFMWFIDIVQHIMDKPFKSIK